MTEDKTRQHNETKLNMFLRSECVDICLKTMLALSQHKTPNRTSAIVYLAADV